MANKKRADKEEKSEDEAAPSPLPTKHAKKREEMVDPGADDLEKGLTRENEEGELEWLDPDQEDSEGDDDDDDGRQEGARNKEGSMGKWSKSS